MMVKNAFILIILIALIGGGCALEEEEVKLVDAASVAALDAYALEMGEALVDVLPDLEGWIREPYSDNMPLLYSEERIEYLLIHRDRLEEIHRRHCGEEFPGYLEIRGWELEIERSGQVWDFDGPAVAEALERFDGAVLDAILLIELIEACEGELEKKGSERVLQYMESVEPAVAGLYYELFRIE